MSDIKNVRSSAVVWWTAGSIVALVVVVWALAASRQRPPAPVPQEAVAAIDITNQPAIKDYLAFADEASARLKSARSEKAPVNERAARNSSIPAMGEAHAFSAEGLRRLASALAVLDEGASDSAAAALRSDARDLEKNPRSLEHADIAQRAFERVAQAIGARDAQGGERLRRIATSIDTSQPLLAQRDRVQRFFAEAGDVIRSENSGIGS